MNIYPLCGFRKGFNCLTAISSLIEKWKQILDNRSYKSAIPINLSNAFDTINHELHTYGFASVSECFS